MNISAAAVLTFIGMFGVLYRFGLLFYRKYGGLPPGLQRIVKLIGNNSLLMLFIFVLLVLAWFRVFIFNNPYLETYNQGNGSYYVQVLHNLSSGVGPENSTKANGSLYYHSNEYYYTSIFSVVPQILSYAVLTPLYMIYPYPPMHVFVIMVLVLGVGAFGVYLAIRSLGGSRILSLLGSCGYCVMPWVILPAIFHGAFDNLGFAVCPYVFAFLFRKRWGLYFISIIIFALINVPYTYYTMVLGVIVAVFFGAYKQGILTVTIGFLIMQWQMAMVRLSLNGILRQEPFSLGASFEFIKSQNFRSLLDPLYFFAGYVVILLTSLAFLPLFGLKRNGKWQYPIIGMLIFSFVAALMGSFRSYSLYFHRNCIIFIPIYLSAFMAYLLFCTEGTKGVDQRRFPSARFLLAVALFSSILSTSLWHNRHYPWSGVRSFLKNGALINVAKPSSNNLKYEKILKEINKFIPPDASIAYRLDAGIEAYVTNRQHAWPLGYNPEGAKYYCIQTQAINYITADFPRWQEWLEKIESDPKFKLLYKDDIFCIFENLDPAPIPRLEKVLGWNLLWKSLVPKNYGAKR